MKKLVTLFCIAILAIYSQNMAISIDAQSYYDCPSVKKFVPTTMGDFCKGWDDWTRLGLFEAEMSCADMYKEMYGQVNKEYATGRCTKQNQKFIEGRYKQTLCSVDFTEGSKPRIVNSSVYDFTEKRIENGEQCLNILYKKLKEAYPNIKMQEVEELY